MGIGEGRPFREDESVSDSMPEENDSTVENGEKAAKMGDDTRDTGNGGSGSESGNGSGKKGPGGFLGMPGKKAVAVILTTVGLLLAATAFMLPWGEIDGHMDISAAGLGASIDINAEMYTYKAHYEVSSTGGVLGNKTTEDTILYTQGLGGFGAVGTILYESPNPVEYTINPLFPAEGEAALEVSLFRNTPVWWPVGVETSYDVNITLAAASQVDYIHIEELRFYIYTDYNESKAESSTMERNVPYDTVRIDKIPVDVNLTSVGDHWSYTYKHTETEYHGRYGVGVEVVYTAVASDGGVTHLGQTSYPGDLPTPNNQIQLTRGETVRIGGMALAPIFLILSMILGAVGLFLTHRVHPHARKVLVSSGILAILSPLFFWWGATGAVGLIPMLAPWFHITAFLFVPLAGGLLLLAGGIVEWEEEVEEQVTFQVEVISPGEVQTEAVLDEESGDGTVERVMEEQVFEEI
ncbi:MAG: hypothetical protein J7L61_03845, partial [Thermoplasmata archaeon]|nr:hypothetical protein [Thermoplasmata archaeon]